LMRELFYPKPEELRERRRLAQTRPATRPAAEAESTGPAFLTREQLNRY
jgi:hypothetical protein